MEFILASQSPRRQQLLLAAGMKFTVCPTDTDENLPGNLPCDLYVMELATLKAAAGAKQAAKEEWEDEVLVIGADTVVSLDGAILGKPESQQEAYDMLCSLSGRWHEVFTGVCVTRAGDGHAAARFCKTRVKFRSLSEEEIWAYIKTGEPMDKAGAYGIQERGGLLTDGIEGDFSNVVGLPLGTLNEILKEEFSYDLLTEG